MDSIDLVRSFYQAFAEKDAEKMVSFYHPDVSFTDPAFGALKGKDVCDMWRMLISKGGEDLIVDLLYVEEEGERVNAKWRAKYSFGKNRRPVVNEVAATFKFKDGQIIRHQDNFDFWKWAGQAMGITGKLLGWTNLFERKVQNTTRGQLSKFRSRQKP